MKDKTITIDESEIKINNNDIKMKTQMHVTLLDGKEMRVYSPRTKEEIINSLRHDNDGTLCYTVERLYIWLNLANVSSIEFDDCDIGETDPVFGYPITSE